MSSALHRLSSTMLLLTLLVVTHTPATAARPAGEVQCRVESLVLPTYEMGPDERNPCFRGFSLPGFQLFRSDRSVYPYPFADKFTRRRVMRTYQAVILENALLRVTVLPELRGRVQGVVDKRNNRDFIYFNHVIKPADIAIRAVWISGGLEWNHPGGHGYTQLTPISFRLLDEPDGGKTVLVSEIEPVRMMQWETAITLRPGRLALETTGRFFGINPAPVPFASSLNGAMHATDGMEMIYPGGTYITGHGKRTLHPWPVFNGVNHAWFKNLDHTLSIFSEDAPESFFGCYSHDDKAGTVIVTDRRTAPGQKYFSWGSAPDGRRWDTLLSDEDGPYIELQVGAFWDNLGYGYAWLDPLEVKSYTVSWYPVMDLGGFVTASRDVCMNVKSPGADRLDVRLQGTRALDNLQLRVLQGDRSLHEQSVTLSPFHPVAASVTVPAGSAETGLTVLLQDTDGRVLLHYNTHTGHPAPPALPERRKPLNQMTLDELYAKGQSYYQDPFSPDAETCYQTMLEQDPKESRALRALGVIAMERGRYDRAVERFQASLRSDPLNGGYETQYYLGTCELALGRLEQARRHFEVAARFGRWTGPALYGLGVTALRSGQAVKAAALFREAAAGTDAPRTWAAAGIAARVAGAPDAARQALDRALTVNPLDFTALAEEFLHGDLPAKQLHGWFDRKDGSFLGSQLYLETALTYMQLGCWRDAERLLTAGIDHLQQAGERVYPMLAYYCGYCRHRLGDDEEAAAWYARAAQGEPDYVFPYHPQSLAVLNDALARDPRDFHAWQYLGNLYYYLRRYREGIDAWERARPLDTENAILHRNLANAYWAMDHDMDKAIASLETAVRCAPGDPRLLLELDHLYAASGRTDARLAMLEQHRAAAAQRDDLVLRWARLYLQTGRPQAAAAMMDTTWFFAREATTHVHDVYAESHYQVAEAMLESGDAQGARGEIERGMQYPDHLSEGRPAGAVEVRPWRLLALVYDTLGDAEQARKYQRSIAAATVPEGSIAQYWQALALRALGRNTEAQTCLQRLEVRMEQTAADHPENAVTWYILSLLQQDAGNADRAAGSLRKALDLDPAVELNARLAACELPRPSL